jgi:hypothetical protein
LPSPTVYDLRETRFHTKAKDKTDTINSATFNPAANTFNHTEYTPSVVKVMAMPTARTKIQIMAVPFRM